MGERKSNGIVVLSAVYGNVLREQGFIRQFKNGVAQVSWQLNPDGRYYMDEDGFGMTDDEEVEIYGFIDMEGKVLVKFRNIEDYGELEVMRKQAEEIVRK